MIREGTAKAFSALMKFYPFATEDLDGEEWRETHYGYYISSFGRVKSVKTSVSRILHPVVRQHKYLIINLWHNSKVKSFTVHRLVATAFIPNPEGKPIINHIDGNSLNNHVSNLEWVTNAENVQHAFDIGLAHGVRGEDHYGAKMTNEQARYVRDNPDGLTMRELATKFDVTFATISDIQTGKKFKNAGGKIREPKKKKFSPKAPEEIRKEIRRLYIKGSKTRGSVALEKMFGYNHTTILRIVHEEN